MVKKSMKERIKGLWYLCPKTNFFFFLSVIWLIVFRLIRFHKDWMNSIMNHVSTPWMHTIATACSVFNFSVAEVLIAGFTGFVLIYIIRIVFLLFHHPSGGLLIVTLGLLIYGGFCLLWGVRYYGDSFQEQSGIYAKDATLEELYQTTLYFVNQLNETADMVPRNEKGIMETNLESYLKESTSLFVPMHKEFPFLAKESMRPKMIFFSELMSQTNFTGFLFPFTGESNVNRKMPQCLMPATIAHELSHQHGVASEQEANFVGIMACMKSGYTDYRYSGALLAYIHLSNALYKEDITLWKKTRKMLSHPVLEDIHYNNAYWKQYKSTTAAKASDVTYNKFLKSYGQKLGTKSYGAVVDLLIVYYGK